MSPVDFDMNMAGVDNAVGFTSYTYDTVLDLYFAQARFYDQNDRRFTQVDPIKDGINWYAYCGNNPVVFVDPSGLWMAGDENLSAQAQMYIHYYGSSWAELNAAGKTAKNSRERDNIEDQMDILHAKANNIRDLDASGKVSGSYYEVPLYDQNGFSLCWAYSQAMVESYYEGHTLSKADANNRARKIAESVYGKTSWNQGGWPTNSPDVELTAKTVSLRHGTSDRLDQAATVVQIHQFSTLESMLSNGPLYAYFSDANGAHLIVVTGAASAPGHEDIVATNNPWNIKKVQTYQRFQKLESTTLQFRGVLRADR